jgi:succinylglutamic semialdehyde dehydrogenase
MGPLIHDASCAAVLSYQDRLRMQGGKEMLAATRLDMKGSFVSPGIIDVTDVTDIPDEEIFGPLLSVYFVSAIADAIAVANNTAYGLSASIITSDIDEFDNVNQSLRVGLLNWNLPTNGAASTLPFGGVGCSGNFRPSAYYAADYCAYPVSRMMSTVCQLPAEIPPGLSL